MILSPSPGKTIGSNLRKGGGAYGKIAQRRSFKEVTTRSQVSIFMASPPQFVPVHLLEEAMRNLLHKYGRPLPEEGQERGNS